jgi:hypothetical protein
MESKQEGKNHEEINCNYNEKIVYSNPYIIKFEVPITSESLPENKKMERIFICTFNDCRKVFFSQNRLQIHIRTHVYIKIINIYLDW